MLPREVRDDLLLRRGPREEEARTDSGASSRAEPWERLYSRRRAGLLRPRQVRGAGAPRGRRRRSRGADRGLDRAEGGRHLGRRPHRQSAAPEREGREGRATTSSRASSSRTRSSRRTRRSRTISRSREGDGRERALPAVHARRVPEAARSLVLRPLGLALRRVGPLEVRVGDRVPVRVVRREAERLVDPRLELLGDRVLEPVGLVVHVVDVRRRASPRGRARAGGDGGSPRARPARRRA